MRHRIAARRRPSLVVANIEEIEEEAASIEEVLEGMELVLGPALEQAVFPGGVPATCSPDEHVTALLAVVLDDEAPSACAVLFPSGVPPRVDAAGVLRATRDAAARERSVLRGELERLQQGERADEAVAESASRLVSLWALSAECHTAAAGFVDPRAALLMHMMAARWSALAQCIHTDIAA